MKLFGLRCHVRKATEKCVARLKAPGPTATKSLKKGMGFWGPCGGGGGIQVVEACNALRCIVWGRAPMPCVGGRRCVGGDGGVCVLWWDRGGGFLTETGSPRCSA